MEETLGLIDHMRQAGRQRLVLHSHPFPGTLMWEEGVRRGVLDPTWISAV